jgi:hypothetical protein
VKDNGHQRQKECKEAQTAKEEIDKGESKRGGASLTKPVPLPLIKGKGIKVEDSSRDGVTLKKS